MASDTFHAAHPERYPGTDEGDGYPVMRCTEGLEMGHRWVQAQGIEPLFGFGHGLSYTSFDVGGVKVDALGGMRARVTVTATVTNTGDRAGAEVVQVYVGIPADGQPPKRLVGFQKVQLEPREQQKVSIVIDPESSNHPFGVWDCRAHAFVDVEGDYTIHVGTSAVDTPHAFTITSTSNA